jgi:hypothetical protein
MAKTDESRPGVPLAKAIEDLRAELLDALVAGQGKDLRFKLKPIELELNLAMTWKGEANAGVKFWVVELGAKGNVERTTSHKLKLILEPVDRHGGEFFVSDHTGSNHTPPP